MKMTIHSHENDDGSGEATHQEIGRRRTFENNCLLQKICFRLYFTVQRIHDRPASYADQLKEQQETNHH